MRASPPNRTDTLLFRDCGKSFAERFYFRKAKFPGVEGPLGEFPGIGGACGEKRERGKNGRNDGPTAVEVDLKSICASERGGCGEKEAERARVEDGGGRGMMDPVEVSITRFWWGTGFGEDVVDMETSRTGDADYGNGGGAIRGGEGVDGVFFTFSGGEVGGGWIMAGGEVSSP